MALKKASSKYPGIFINEYKNGNVAYYINYRNEEGTPTLKKVGMKTKQSNYTIMDAYDRLIEVKHKIATGEELPKVVQRKAKVLFEDIFEDYLNWAKANKKTWKHNDLLVYNKHLSYLAKSDPRTLKPKDFEELKQRKLTEADKNGRVLAPKTVQHILATARHIFNHAIKNELIKNLTNPIGSGRVRMPKFENAKIGFFTKEKAKELLELLQQRENKRLYELTVLLLFTGARFSEVSRLTWADVNFNTNLIFFASSKDGNARYIKMSNRVLEVVNSLYKNKINNLVIPTINGNKYEKMPKEWQIEVDRLIPENENANKDRLTTHSLRHTHASWLAQSGVDILHIKEQLGHRKIDTTMRYSHLIDDRRHQATERLNF
ncbi:site-specific integrase [Aliarcobacter butzleri]|uniref:tyrosine-type recombinase/integrase n=1 Tax=Aliarcobacter butzleri TaxID=28197 RepID=UPI00125F119C|nr:site-specific integrase [Aliarcobacter butzleri]MCG3658356.1 site-specific integrase [Aliarcobacter butzleri]MCT7550682.1 site-specific integrase [Aliarcobacter butzleri]MCT7559281.1 site-specific integrase [Aliarcobacter butzleri]MDN5082994.1 site-specific integrase [Aliarcobacter butzleri]MDN5085074.1 site-specific integrase [Aliarcobacter butzleri]